MFNPPTTIEIADYLGDPGRNIKVPAAFLIKAREKNKPKYAARYLVRMLFPRDVLMCSSMEGDKARGIKPLDPNWVTGLRGKCPFEWQTVNQLLEILKFVSYGINYNRSLIIIGHCIWGAACSLFACFRTELVVRIQLQSLSFDKLTCLLMALNSKVLVHNLLMLFSSWLPKRFI